MNTHSEFSTSLRLSLRAALLSFALWLALALIASTLLAANFSARQPATVALDPGLSLIRLALPQIREGTVRLLGVDPKGGMELGIGRELFARLVGKTDSRDSETIALLRDAVANFECKLVKIFQPGDCPESALYCGWYSLSRYVDAFTWVRGAIGYHIASGECTTLKRPESQVWCKRMLERGIAATIGPVNEPYVQAFPLPELFFPLLTEGYLSLGETYLITLPFLSWQMVLIGDPLYQPFQPTHR